MDPWLSNTRDAVARAAGVPSEQLALDDEQVRTLLDLARIAAHESGERTNAPLLCYLVGVAAEAGEATLAELAEAVKRAAP